MMTKNQINEREQLEMLTIDQLVPQDHLVRKLEAAIDFSFIYPLVENLYSAKGRPSIDPVVLFKMTFIQYVLVYGPCVKPSKKLKQIWRIVGFRIWLPYRSPAFLYLR